jgi:hypothetical protein
MAIALIGPDVDVHVLCAGSAQAPIASIDEIGAGITRWSFTVAGDPAFSPGPVQSGNAMPVLPSPGPGATAFAVCQSNSPEVAFVAFNAPPDALPGSTFVGTAIVRAEDGSFADGTVKLRGEVTTPVVTVDTTSVDFGTIAPGDTPTMPINFTFENASLILTPDSDADPPFYISKGRVPVQPSNTSSWSVMVMSNVPGEYSTTVGWRAVPSSFPPPVPDSCVWTTNISLHVRVDGDGGADASPADANDGGADLAAETP